MKRLRTHVYICVSYGIEVQGDGCVGDVVGAEQTLGGGEQVKKSASELSVVPVVGGVVVVGVLWKTKRLL